MESFSNPPASELRRLLEETRRIAVVGLSDNPARPSHRVSAYLQQQGYAIRPVNPGIRQALGEAAVAELAALGEELDMVCIFRRSEEVAAIVESALARGCRSIWMQDGVADQAAALKARAAGVVVVMNDCLLRRHQQLIGPARG
jgi:uncharacterized protein